MNKKYYYLLLPLALVLIAATVVTPGKRITEYPRASSLADTDVLVAGRTNAAVPTNVGITALNLLIQATNGLASTSYVTTVVTGALAAVPAELWTNSGGIVMLTTNGPVSIASTGLLGGLVVTQDMRILGHGADSNRVWTATNATTGEGEWRTVEALVAFRLGLTNDPDRLILQAEPVRGALYYTGTNGYPSTNGQRRGIEFDANKASIRIGSVGNIGVARHNTIAESNYWNFENVQLGSSILGGSNNLANAIFSTIGGGVGNHIYTNAGASFIGGGTNNYIRTNARNSVVVGGNFNQIHVDSHSSFIGGGTSHEIMGGAQHATIAGGQAQIIGGANAGGQNYAFMGGGLNNTLGDEATGASEKAVLVGGELNRCNGDWAFLGGGSQNAFVADCDYSTIVGGLGNGMGANPNSGVLYAFVGGGRGNGILNSSESSVIVGGRDNTLSAASSNSFIAGGYINLVSTSTKFASILAGERNTVSGNYGFTLGSSNTVNAERAGAIGMNVTNATAGSVTVSELISYNTPAVIAGAGSGSTNYLLAVTSPKMLMGSSNVNIYGVSGTIAGKTHNWSVNITNLSANTWGIQFASGTNRWKFQSWMYGTNAPSVLTNNTLLRLNGESEGTNTLVTYEYFSPAL